MAGVVEEIFVTTQGSAAMQRVDEVKTVEGCGIQGDRYCEGTGFWTQYGDVCQITFIAAEDLDFIDNELDIRVKDGEHRRNVVVRDVDLLSLRGKRFRVGEATFEYDRSRPPCKHVQDLTEPGMTRALKNRGGICARVVSAGAIRAGDTLEVE